MQKRVALLLELIAALLFWQAALADTAIVTVDGAQTYQVIDGFGANVNHRGWNNSELQPVLDAMIDQGGMTLFRLIFDKADWESANDNSDPNVMDWDYYRPVYNTADFQKMWDMSAYLNQKGISNGLMFNFHGGGPEWMMDTNGLASGYEAEYAEMVASLLTYARNTKHLQFSLVGPGNEEDIIPQGVIMTGDQYVTALHKLAELLDANGLGDVRFVGPDLGNTSTDWLSAMMGDQTGMAKLAHFGLHSYQDNGGGSAGIYDMLQQSAYPETSYWMTEFNVWCDSCEAGLSGTNVWDYACGAARYLLYHLYYGASAGLVWEGYDSQYNYYSPGQWSYWGLFGVDDVNAVPKTYTPRKIFYTLAQISKYVRPGAQQIDVSGADGAFMLLAFYHPDSGQLTLTGIHTNTSSETLSAVLTNLPPVASLDLYYTDSTTNLCHAGTFSVTNGAFGADIPANCVFTLVGFDPAKIAVSVLITNPLDGTRYSAPATIPIQASATTTAGELTQVEFFSGATNLGAAVAAPYTITWSNVPPGTYMLTASVTNSVGTIVVSPSVRVRVVGPIAQIGITPSNAAVVPYGTQQFIAVATDALGSIISPPPAFTWSVSGGGTIDNKGLFIAGGDVGGLFTIIANTNGLTGTANVFIGTNLNLAPVGLGYAWNSLAASTDNAPQVAAAGLNDGDLHVDVPLGPGGDEDIRSAFEAAGIIWPTTQTINRVIYVNGSYNSYFDGVFAAGFGLQFSSDGTTWTNAGAEWTVAPTYSYNSPASANVSFTFTGGVATLRGVRCVGCVHSTTFKTNSWVAFATELQAFAAPAPLPPVLTASAGTDGMVISWPGGMTNYVLQATPDLQSQSGWITLTNFPQAVGDELRVIIAPGSTQQFLRLYRP